MEGFKMQTENSLMSVDNVPDVEIAKKQWKAYQELCKGILDTSDYQKIIVKEKDENGNYVKIPREFKKKSAWQKLARAFNVDTTIVERDIVRTKTGRIKEAYYCVRATLPNGRRVESDALCSRSEKGKDKVSDHTIMSIAKTRATNRAISELIGAAEVSSDEITAEFKALDDADHHYISGTLTENDDESFVTPEEDEPKIIPDKPKKDNQISNAKSESKPVGTPKCIGKALQRIASKGVEITPETVQAHVNWRQISDDEKEAAKAYIEAMGG